MTDIDQPDIAPEPPYGPFPHVDDIDIGTDAEQDQPDADTLDIDTGTVLDADTLSSTHPELPPGWSRTMAEIRAYGGPWGCDTCPGPTYLPYRCSRCGADLARSQQ